MPDLSTQQGQAQIEEFITPEIELIIIDNLSCLVRSGRENEAESWQPIQDFALRLRAKGKSVLFIHHSGKTGNQRGTSRREDVLDTVISLRHPKEYTQDKGALFEVHFEKARYLYGQEATPFEAQLTTNAQGLQCWVTRSLEASTFDKVVNLSKEGLSQKEISEELGINKSVVSRHIKNAREQGKI
jgi:RecA-family ATPase